MTLTSLPPMAMSDEQLWRRSLAGDREAFGEIVARYQSLVCALAYSACGDLPRSEDVAQDTFIAAWRGLGELREPAKLRQWLCGIARKRVASTVRRELRASGLNDADPVSDELAAPDAGPAEQTVSREEAELLWQTLARLPEAYREPLVLFYRQQQSVAEVAEGLDLTEDAVRQRLSRGRALLRGELAALVESALTRTRPAAAFTAGVLASLPLLAPPRAEAAAGSTAAVLAGKAAAAGAKGGLLGLVLGVLVGPAVGLLVGISSARTIARTARSPEERACIHRFARRIVLFCFAMSAGLALVLSQAGRLYHPSPAWLISGVLLWVAALVGAILWGNSRMQGEVRRIRLETNTGDDVHGELQDAVALEGIGISRAGR